MGKFQVSPIQPVRVEIPHQGDYRTISRAVRQAGAPGFPLRWAVVGAKAERLQIEISVWDGAPEPVWPEPADTVPAAPNSASSPSTVVQILPTGIGLQHGGYAGDGTPATNLLARAADRVVTHPNAVNAAGLNWAASNVLYVEGAMLDAWLAGAIALRPVRANKVGVLVDRALAQSSASVWVDNSIGAFRAVGGGRALIAYTDEPLDLGLTVGESGVSSGTVGNPQVLVTGARDLVGRGAETIAVVGDFRPLVSADADPADPYLQGHGVDPIGGLEAILSHILWHCVGLPGAHAPFLWPSVSVCDPRAAAEELGGTYLACVLRGLSRAPRPVARQQAQLGDLVDPDWLVVPEGAVGGPGTLAAASRGIGVVTVRNPSVLDLKAADLGLETIAARSYLEAAGVILALGAGLDPARLLI